MPKIVRPVILDQTGQEIAAAIRGLAPASQQVVSLSETVVARNVYEIIGIPPYIDDVSQYASYGLTETGWYAFLRLMAPPGVLSSCVTSVTGAAGSVVNPGDDHVDVAVRFDVAAQSQVVTVNWAEEQAEGFVFKATDLSVRNLDFRVKFTIYPLDPYVIWAYTLTEDTTFTAGKTYYTESDGVYTLAEVTAGEAVPENTYYNHSKLTISGAIRNVTYKLDTIVDCPLEIILPEVDNDEDGVWYEFQLRYDNSYSCTLVPPEGVKIGTATTQNQTAGINTIDLQYTNVGGVQLWTLLNTHANIPA